MNIALVIPAAGLGTRMNTEIPKQFIEVNNIPIIVRTIKLFDTIEKIDSIVLPVHTEWISYTKDLVEKFDCKKVKEITIGGRERQDSVYTGLNSEVVKDTDLVLIHDAVRPFASKKLINKLIEVADDCGAAIPIIKTSDSVKQIDNRELVLKTLDRNHIGLVQTPQAYWTSLAIEAYKKAAIANYYGSDTSSLVEFIGYKVKYVEGEVNNIKITSPLDLELAAILTSNT